MASRIILQVTQLVLELGQARQALVEANAKVDAAEVRRNSRSLEITRDHSRSLEIVPP